MQIKFSFKQLSELQYAYNEKQKRILDPSIDLIEKGEKEVEIKKTKLLEVLEQTTLPQINVEMELLNEKDLKF